MDFDALGEKFNLILNQALDKYGLVVACVVIGVFIGWYGKYLLSDRKYHKQINLRIREKETLISKLSFLVHERLEKVDVQTHDKVFFKRLKKYFKRNFKIEP